MMWGISPKPKKGGLMFSLASTYVNKISFEILGKKIFLSSE